MIILTRRRKDEKHSEEEVLEFNTFAEAKHAAFGYKHTRIRCDSCEAVSIQGVPCHELGCPGAWRDSKPECRECGDNFTPEHAGQEVCPDCCVALEENMSREADEDARHA